MKLDPQPYIRERFAPLPPEQLAQARGMDAATVHEAFGRQGALPCAIRPVFPCPVVAGPALTVQSPGGDNLWIHRALDVAQPGDVLVVHVSGQHGYGYWGEILSAAAHARQLAALVIDGCVRDIAQLERIGFPVFARGLSIRGTGKDFGAIGWIHAPVTVEDVVIASGDLVLGDRDGVVAVPRDRVAHALAGAQARMDKEQQILERIAAGESTMDIYGFR